MNRRIFKHFCQSKKIKMFAHALGLSAIGASLFLEVMVFRGILGQGYFRGVESNPFVVCFEIILVIIAFLYYGYLLGRLLSTKTKFQ